jgi:hypothetical protein
LFNFKAGGIAAGTAFILSFCIGLFSGIGFLALIVRALLFGALFFGLSCLVFWLLGQFVPELLNEGEDGIDIPLPGSRVNISIDGGPPEGAFPQDSSDSVDDIGGRPSTEVRQNPLDQDDNVDYNGEKALADSLGSFSTGDISGAPASSGAALPNMDSLSEAFTPQPGGLGGGDVSFDTPEPRRPRSSSGSGKTTLKGDFNPKELAQAIQTVLKKDEKG